MPLSIVVVSHFCPFPVLHGNGSRLVALLRWLKSKGYHVTYVLQPLDVDRRIGIPLLAETVDRLEIVVSPFESGPIVKLMKAVGWCAVKAFLPGTVWYRARDIFKRLVPQRPAVMESSRTGDVAWDRHIDRWCWLGTCEAVCRIVQELEPVAVMTEYALLSKCLEMVPASTLKVIDTVEVFFRNRERFQTDGLAAPFVCTPESEQEALERADLLIGIQRNETLALQELFPKKRVITVSHSYTQLGDRARTPAEGVILYVGSSNPFNVHGLRQFLTHAWPRIVSNVPLAQLRIVGSCSRIEDVDSERVIYVGRVSDEELRSEYRTAHVVINPQVAGTGLKIKCVEALTVGCPIVMNQAGADGLEEGAGSAFLLADGWPEFARHVVRILTDDALRKKLEAGSLRLAERLFSAESVFAELAHALDDRVRLRSAVRSS